MNNRFFTYAEIFVAVARCGSLTSAADMLHSSKSTLSQKLTEFEKDLNVQLLTRTTRKVTLTTAGEKILAQCAKAVDAVTLARFEIGLPGTGDTPLSGTATLSGSNIYLSDIVLPLLQPFRRQYPQIKVNLMGSDHPVTLQNSNVDLRIRLGPAPADSLKVTPLQPLQRIVCASVQLQPYLHKISHPRDLARVPIIRREQEPDSWTLRKQEETFTVDLTSPAMTVSSYELCREAVAGGCGIALLAKRCVQEELQSGRMFTVLPDWKADDIAASLLMNPARITRPHVRVLANYLRSELGGAETS